MLNDHSKKKKEVWCVIWIPHPENIRGDADSNDASKEGIIMQALAFVEAFDQAHGVRTHVKDQMWLLSQNSS